ncbi:MAG: hypothetical protein ABR518_04170 [Actinomycetota bacterium]
MARDRGFGGDVRGGIRTILLVAAVIFFIISMATDTNPADWLTLGLIFLTVGLMSDTLDLTFRKKWE